MTDVERKPVYALLMMRFVDYSFIVEVNRAHVVAVLAIVVVVIVAVCDWAWVCAGVCLCIPYRWLRITHRKWTGSVNELCKRDINCLLMLSMPLHATVACAMVGVSAYASAEASPSNWLQCHLNPAEYNGFHTKETICSSFLSVSHSNSLYHCTAERRLRHIQIHMCVRVFVRITSMPYALLCPLSNTILQYSIWIPQKKVDGRSFLLSFLRNQSKLIQLHFGYLMPQKRIVSIRSPFHVHCFAQIQHSPNASWECQTKITKATSKQMQRNVHDTFHRNRFSCCTAWPIRLPHICTVSNWPIHSPKPASFSVIR